jgi:excisionase family DNA binding protein
MFQMSDDPENDRLLSDTELRSFLGVSRTTLWRLRHSGGLPFGKVGHEYRYRKWEVLEWVKDRGFHSVQLPLQLRRTRRVKAGKAKSGEEK